MANKIFNTRVKNKRDTEANWTSKNPVLLNGEIAIVDTTSGETRFKVGDGTNRYSQLPFQDAATLANYVKTTRKINNKALSSDISLTASDVGALPSTTTALKNPNALTFTGAVTGSYDGSAAKTVAIPSVDTALSDTSANPVQNKAVSAALEKKANSTNAILKDYVYVTSSDGTEGVVMHSDDASIDGISTLELESMKGNGVTIGGLENVADPEALGRDDIAVSYAMMKDYVDNNKPSVATTSANGLMSADDKTKLDGIATGANKTTVDSALSTTSTNPVQNKAVKAALDSKLNTSGGTLTGNLTGQYLTGTWLQTTEATDLGSAPSKIAVLDGSGWVYYRTLTEIKTDIGVDVSSLVDLFYPIGSIYMSTNQTDNPQSRFSGTYWLPIYDRFLLGAGNTYKTAKATGGEATHTLTANEMPNHQHSIWFPNSSGEQNAAIGFPTAGSKNTYYAEASKTGGAGGGTAHNNMPPYYTVYMWRRVTFQEYEAGADGG